MGVCLCVFIVLIDLFFIFKQDDAQRSLELADDDIKHAHDQLDKYRNEAMALRVRYLGSLSSGTRDIIFILKDSSPYVICVLKQ